MKSFRQLCVQGLRAVGHTAASIVIWTCWLALGATLAVQLWWLGTREMAVPDFVLRSLEERLALSALHATFGRTAFDPSGRILVEDFKLFSPTFTEPLVTARSAYLRLDPWQLITGSFEPIELRASGVNLFVPAMLSASGRAEALARDVEIVLVPGDQEIGLSQFNARIGPLDLAARGGFRLAPRKTAGASFPIADYIARDYPRLSQRLANYLGYLKGLDQPRLEVLFTPTSSHGALATATLVARSLDLEQPIKLQANDVIVSTRFPVTGETGTKIQLDLAAGKVTVPNRGSMGGMRAVTRGLFRPEQRDFVPDQAEISAEWVTGSGFDAAPFAASLVPRANAWHGTLSTAFGGAPITVAGETNPTEKTARLRVEGRFYPGLLDPISNVTQRDLGAILQLTTPPEFVADVRLAPGWKLGTVDARFNASNLTARRVALDYVSARVSLVGSQLDATEVVLLTRGNAARGSYGMDLASRDYRFLLDGRLYPVDIQGWFGPWWPQFFANFAFGPDRPQADVDVQGRWGDVTRSLQFVQVHAPQTAIRGVSFDDVRTTLFIRPGFYDALELRTTQGNGFLHGLFTYTVTPGRGTMRTLDFVSDSTIDVRDAARIFGPQGIEIVEPFRFSSPPRLQLKGHLDGPAAPNGPHQAVQIQAESQGPFGLFDFPLSNLSFQADLKDNDLSVHDVKVNFADGLASGHVRLSGIGRNRRLRFDASVSRADLGKAIASVESFSARRGGKTTPGKNSVFEKGGVQLDLTADGEGRYDDLYSFQGKGEAELTGTELAEVRLLGQLSELFNFTALRFTNLRTSFKLKGPQLELPDIRISGTNSSVTAHGTYALDRKELDINAKLFPFGGSKFFPVAIIGAVLSPLSQILEVHLTGSLDKPSWEFVRGPRSFLRSLGGSPRAVARPSPPGIVPTNKELSPYIRRNSESK